MADSAVETLTGIVSRLSAVTAVTDLVSTRIYTSVPQNTTFPYIVLTLDSTPFRANTFSEQTHNLTVQCFSRKGVKEALDIRKQVDAALDRQGENVSLSGFVVVELVRESSTWFVEPDGVTWQGIVEFTITVE